MWLEHVFDVKHRNGNMLPADEVKNLQGFRSVYGFSQEDAASIRQSGNSKGFVAYPLISDCLFIDLDHGESHVKQTEEFLKSKNVAYQLYSSGGKGFHFHIPHKLLQGYDIYKTHERYAKKICGDAYDPSIYRPGSLIRLPNTVHKKTGKQKELITVSLGQSLKIVHKDDDRVYTSRGIYTSSEDILPMSLCQALAYCNNTPVRGKRYMTLWSLGSSLVEAGFSRESIFDFLLIINNSWADKKPADEIYRCVDDVYRGKP